MVLTALIGSTSNYVSAMKRKFWDNYPIRSPHSGHLGLH
jgi:hypothetical protein